MPTRIDVQEYTEDPVFVFADPTGNYFRNVGNVEFIVYNGDSANETKPVLLTTQRACNHGIIRDRQLNVRRGWTEYYGGFTAQQFNDHAGDMYITYPSGSTGFRVAVRKLPRR